jgi:hypothetical protein
MVLAGLALCLFSATETKADPLMFSNVVALQNEIRVDLFSNPGTTLFGPQISFLVDITGTIPDNGLHTLRVTFTEAGQAPIVQTFSIPAFGIIPPPFTQLLTLTTLNTNTQATLTIDILGNSPDFIIPGGPGIGQPVDSFTFTFNVAEPVPEPTTIILVGTGLIGLVARLRRRRSD